MAHSDVSICNSGLRRIGQEPILSFDDVTQNARLCKQFFAVERDYVFREYPWGFASKRATLARSSTAPEWEYSFAYPLPSDFMRLIKVQDDTYDKYEIEQVAGVTSIVTDLETVRIKYTSRITDASIFDPAFAEMLAMRMAAVLAYPLTESNTLTERMWQLYESYEIGAYSADGQEGTPDALEDRSLIDIRI